MRGSLARSCESSTPVETKVVNSRVKLSSILWSYSTPQVIKLDLDGSGWIMLINIYHQGYSSITTLPSSKRPESSLRFRFHPWDTQFSRTTHASWPSEILGFFQRQQIQTRETAPTFQFPRVKGFAPGKSPMSVNWGSCKGRWEIADAFHSIIAHGVT